MRVRIIERFCEGKYRDDRNEDAVAINAGFVAVIDGSTAAGAVAGEAGGRLAARLVSEVIDRLPHGAEVGEFVALATHALRTTSANSTGGAPFAAAVVLSLSRRQIWRIGDCPFGIDGRWRIADHFPHERAYFAFRRMMVSGYRDRGREAEGAAALAPITRDWLEMTRGWLNAECHPMSFAALGGSLPPAQFVEIVEVPPGAREIALASDGTIVSPEGQRGPADVADMLTQIAELKARDPDCLDLFDYWRGFPSGAAYLDDTSLIRLSIEEG